MYPAISGQEAICAWGFAALNLVALYDVGPCAHELACASDAPSRPRTAGFATVKEYGTEACHVQLVSESGRCFHLCLPCQLVP